VSGDLDEYRIRELVNAGAPIDSFGVGTQLATSGRRPPRSAAIYKMVEIEFRGIQRFTAKYSAGKISLPGSSRFSARRARDVVARSANAAMARRLLRPVILGGRLVEPLPTVEPSPPARGRVLGEAAPGSADNWK